MLSFCDWSWVCKQSSVDSALSEIDPIVTESLNQANAYMCSGKSTFPCWFQVFWNIILFYVPSVIKDLGVLLACKLLIPLPHWLYIFLGPKMGFDSLYYLSFLHSSQHLYFLHHHCTTQNGICVSCPVLHYIDGFVQTRKGSRKICFLVSQQIFYGRTLQWWWSHFS